MNNVDLLVSHASYAVQVVIQSQEVNQRCLRGPNSYAVLLDLFDALFQSIRLTGCDVEHELNVKCRTRYYNTIET